MTKDIYLSEGTLSLRVVAGGHTGTRFDHTAYVDQIRAGARAFDTLERLEPGMGTGGRGLSFEFGIDAPVGHDDALPGEPFLKPGVGWLLRTEKPYSFVAPYEVLEPGEIDCEASAREVMLRWRASVRRGYGCAIERSFRLEVGRLIVRTTMENTGEKPLSTNEYCHNFVNVDGAPLAECAFDVDDALVRAAGFDECLQAEKYPFYRRLEGGVLGALSSWRLSHARGLVSETVDFRPVRFALWALPHVVSPELFAGIEVLPGEAKTWTRTYEFRG